MLITTWEADYNRNGYMEITSAKCHVCSKVAECLCVDSSEGEYGPGAICLDCINEFFERNARLTSEEKKMRPLDEIGPYERLVHTMFQLTPERPYEFTSDAQIARAEYQDKEGLVRKLLEQNYRLPDGTVTEQVDEKVASLAQVSRTFVKDIRQRFFGANID